MRQKLIMLAVVAACAWTSGAMALTKDEFNTQKDRIEADYKAAKEKCKDLKANAKDICMSEAKGVEKVAKVELDAQYKPSPKADAKVRDAKADAVYDLAKEKCDDLAGKPKDTCVKDAKMTHANAKGDAKVSKTPTS
ncbi:MAG TPA: hypothetical protein VLJ57_11955 [Burkholderiaceae bacterium]|nr:hypothetical protein [Burkholderiaceae bacterium]